jgi:hypothetical protein
MFGAGRARRQIGTVAATVLLAVTIGTVATAAHGKRLDDLLPHLRTGFAAEPVPIPAPSAGRVPVGLRLADSISTDDGSHPPAATEARFEFGKQFRIDLSGVPRCPAGPHFDIRTPESPCEEVKFATGKMKFEVAFPELEPLLVTGRAIAFKTDDRKMTILAYFPAPITGEVVIPVQLGRAPGRSVYGITATASIPKVAGGYGSLVYLGLRFRKGIFSVACPDRRLQSRVTNTFADGSVSSLARLANC